MSNYFKDSENLIDKFEPEEGSNLKELKKKNVLSTNNNKQGNNDSTSNITREADNLISFSESEDENNSYINLYHSNSSKSDFNSNNQTTNDEKKDETSDLTSSLDNVDSKSNFIINKGNQQNVEMDRNVLPNRQLQYEEVVLTNQFPNTNSDIKKTKEILDEMKQLKDARIIKHPRLRIDTALKYAQKNFFDYMNKEIFCYFNIKIKLKNMTFHETQEIFSNILENFIEKYRQGLDFQRLKCKDLLNHTLFDIYSNNFLTSDFKRKISKEPIENDEEYKYYYYCAELLLPKYFDGTVKIIHNEERKKSRHFSN